MASSIAPWRLTKPVASSRAHGVLHTSWRLFFQGPWRLAELMGSFLTKPMASSRAHGVSQSLWRFSCRAHGVLQGTWGLFSKSPWRLAEPMVSCKAHGFLQSSDPAAAVTVDQASKSRQ
ncbi:hypothetical protein DUNSADRAFT_14198 [Dunaliella salina]|uniref:Encoded protein n=1 Tax=Dunaliella salina TaxID=3046 RepID=A0ABQ7G7T0_DUNSA|nr:hypothetical protein DUNSADRAFT_14198 [Dunaliella salina]KAF5830661.1 hypothetical protein DUNSADRAFT_14198 [Dunaliella salina]|eukprot:KAF5830660.1 hypothetical protein DUNSADRAFT_14198 [Dunaliella salina]